MLRNLVVIINKVGLLDYGAHMKKSTYSYGMGVILVLLLNAGIAGANDVESKFVQAGLVDVSSIDPSILVDLVNSDPKKNYFRENFYDGLNKAYLRKDVAQKLSNAQNRLQNKHPNDSLQILDAARPRSVSRLMYEKMKGTKFEKYVAHPDKGSMHNYGIAVDITIVDANGKELDMGYSPFRKSKMELFWLFAKKRLGIKVTEKQRANRKRLAQAMVGAGFLPLDFEWWHFNGMPKREARKRFQIIE